MTTVNKIKVYMGVPSTGDRCDVQNYNLRALQDQFKDQVELVYPKHWIGRIFHDYARNMIVKDFLASDCDVLWFLDSDVAPPAAIGEYFTIHWDKWKVAGAPYPLFLTPSGHDMPKVVFAVYEDLGKGYNCAAVPNQGTGFVDGIATGCIMIKREVMEQIAAPQFEFKYDPLTRQMTEGEDLGFCKKVNALGHKFFIDYSMTCHHFKRVNLLDVNNYCISEFNARWMAMDQQFRAELTKIKLGVKPKSSLILPK